MAALFTEFIGDNREIRLEFFNKSFSLNGRNVFVRECINAEVREAITDTIHRAFHIGKDSALQDVRRALGIREEQ